MESNKEEARRSLAIAERKLSKNDYSGAKKYANKAQSLYPKLGGVEQMLIMIDVHISASNKNVGRRGGEADWYGILGVDPLADDEALKKRYKRLALLLHPDKNRFNGAEDAFKLVLQAWDLLSDKAKRSAYDHKRKSKQVREHRSGTHKPRQPHEPTPSYWSEFKPYNGARPDQPKHEPKKPEPRKPEPKHEPMKPEPKQPKPKPDLSLKYRTFWTVCNSDRCKTYLKLSGDYLNKTLTCENCRQDLAATELLPEIINGRPVIILSPCNQPMGKSTSDTFSASGSNSAKTNGAPKRTIRWFEPKPEPDSDSSPNKEKASMFWTLCNRCKTLFKCVRANSLNKNLACPYCSEDFLAAEIIPAISNGRPLIILSLPSGQSRSKNTSSDASSSSTTSASGRAKTARQKEEILKRWFPESRAKIAADFAAAAAGGNAEEAQRLYKKMTTGNNKSSFQADSLFEEPMRADNANSTLEAERLFKDAHDRCEIRSKAFGV